MSPETRLRHLSISGICTPDCPACAAGEPLGRKDALTSNERASWPYEEPPADVVVAARLLRRWADERALTAWSVLGIGESDQGEVQRRLSEQIVLNLNLRTELERRRALLLEYLPEHDGLFHNDYRPEDRASCKECQLRAELERGADTSGESHASQK